MIVSIDWDAPKLYRFPLLRYRRLRRKLRQCFRALQVLGLLPDDVEVRHSSTGKGFHVLLHYSDRSVPTRRVRALCGDDPVRLAWDLVRKELGVRTMRLRHAKRRHEKRHAERYDQKGTRIARELLSSFH